MRDRPAEAGARLSVSLAPARSLLAFGAVLLGIAVFSGMDAVVKRLVLSIGVYSALLWRSVAGSVISGALYAVARPAWPGRHAMLVHVQRGAISTLMVVSFFWGLARMPMAQAVALTFIAPLISLFLAAALLDERIHRGTVVASCTAFGGVLVILSGQWRSASGGGEVLAGSAAVLVSAVCYAFNIVLMRRQALVAGPAEVAFSQSLVVAVLLALALPFLPAWPAVRVSPELVVGIVLAAAMAVVSLLLLAWGYARGEANYLATAEYSSFVWAALFGWLVFGERVSLMTTAGAALIVGGCVTATRPRALLGRGVAEQGGVAGDVGEVG